MIPTAENSSAGWGANGIALGAVVNAPEPPPTPSYVPEGPAYVPGEPPEDQFRTPVHCVRISADGTVYVCDRRNDRIQIFTKQGKFLKEFLLHRETRGYGSVWIVNFFARPGAKIFAGRRWRQPAHLGDRSPDWPRDITLRRRLSAHRAPGRAWIRTAIIITGDVGFPQPRHSRAGQRQDTPEIHSGVRAHCLLPCGRVGKLPLYFL